MPILTPIKNLNIERHIFSSFAADMQSALSSLTKKLHIKYFSYAKLYADKSDAFLTTHPGISEIFAEQKTYKDIFFDDPKSYKAGYYFCDDFSNQTILDYRNAIVEKYYIDHQFIIVQPAGEQCDFFYFAVDKNNYAINNMYVNNLDVLQSFCNNFKQQCSKVIKVMENNRIVVPNNTKDNTILPVQNMIIPNKGSNYSDHNLTGKEQQCAQYLKQGLTAKEIARLMNISYRTVEKHVDHLKIKLKCSSKLKLLIKLQNDYY